MGTAVKHTLCVSHPLVTPYYCRLGDLLCFVFIVSLLYFSVNCVISVFLQYCDTVGWVFWPVKTVARITYTVLVETLNHAQSINQSAIKHPVPDHVNQSFVIFHILALRAECQSAWMSKITNDGLARSGTGCFVATHMETMGVKVF